MTREPYITDTGIVFHKKGYQRFPVDRLFIRADVSWILLHDGQAFFQNTIPANFIRLCKILTLQMAYLTRRKELLNKLLLELLVT